MTIMQIRVCLYVYQDVTFKTRQIDFIKDLGNNISDERWNELLSEKLSDEECSEIIEKIGEDKRVETYRKAKEIGEIDYISYKSLIKLSYIASLLNILVSDTGFSFDLYNPEEILEYEFHRTLINFSSISAAVAFIPFLPISDIFVNTPLQVAMINKIFDMYGFEVNAMEVIKMISGTLGGNIISKIVSKILSSFIPFRWVINASVAFATTYATGVIARSYQEMDGNLSKEKLEQLWIKSYETGKKEFDTFKGYIFNNKGRLIDSFKSYFSKREPEESSGEV